MRQKSMQTLAVSMQVIATSLLLIVAAANLVECDRSSSGGRRVAAGGGVADQFGFRSNCGNAEQVSQMLGNCIVPMMEIAEGKFKEPKTDEDLQAICQRFNITDTCIRQITKDCLTGLPKSSSSAIASAIRRLRARECKSAELRAKYMEPLKCSVRNGKDVDNIYKNMTGISQSIRDLPDLKPEEKMLKVCCLLNELDRNLETSYNRDCPGSTPIIMTILHAVTDDARSTLCRSPKCENALKKVIPSRIKQKQIFIEPILQILFMLNSD